MHLILFDIDGTLMRGIGIGTGALKRAFAEGFGLETENHPALANVFVAGSTDPVILRHMAEALEIPSDTFSARRDTLEATYFRLLEEILATHTSKAACAGIPEILPRLEAHERIALGLLTGNFERSGRLKLEPFGLNRYFAHGGFGGDGPDRAAQALFAVERAQAVTGARYSPENVMVIGDTVNDVAAGRAHGFLTVGVGTGWGKLEDIQAAGATAVFPSLEPEHGFERWLNARWNLGW